MLGGRCQKFVGPLCPHDARSLDQVCACPSEDRRWLEQESEPLTGRRHEATTGRYAAVIVVHVVGVQRGQQVSCMSMTPVKQSTNQVLESSIDSGFVVQKHRRYNAPEGTKRGTLLQSKCQGSTLAAVRPVVKKNNFRPKHLNTSTASELGIHLDARAWLQWLQPWAVSGLQEFRIRWHHLSTPLPIAYQCARVRCVPLPAYTTRTHWHTVYQVLGTFPICV